MFKEFYEKFSEVLVKMRQKWTPHMNTHFNQHLQHNSLNIMWKIFWTSVHFFWKCYDWDDYRLRMLCRFLKSYTGHFNSGSKCAKDFITIILLTIHYFYTFNVLLYKHIEDRAFKLFKCTFQGFKSEWGQVSINIRQQDHSETGSMYCIIKFIVQGKQAHVKNTDLRHPSCTVVM